jgi:hypothetical protein
MITPARIQPRPAKKPPRINHKILRIKISMSIALLSGNADGNTLP